MLKSLFDGHWPAAILFDLDGTLIDSVPELARALDAALTGGGLPAAGINNTRLWVGNGARVLVQRALAHALQLPQDAVPAALLEDSLQRFLAAYSHNQSSPHDLYDGVADTLQQLAQLPIRLAIVTNKPIRFVPSILENCGIAGHFGLLLGGDSLAEKKPHPAPLLHAVNTLGASTANSLMVGDSANDILAANAAGMRSVCVSWGYNHGDNPLQLPASAHIHHISELLG
ncbi:MAG TPA: phosphoglycolate phosphatase [Pseudomonadales bacterium]